MRNKATESLKASKSKYFTSAVNDNKDNPKAMWKLFKSYHHLKTLKYLVLFITKVKHIHLPRK